MTTHLQLEGAHAMDTELVENPEFNDPDGIHRQPSPLVALLVETFEDMRWYALATDTEERWPLVRFGERERIPPFVRRLIFERDGGMCLSCGIPLTIRTARLDHIVPWSAGGPDTSGNLRLLCEPCNAGRSNFRTGLDDHAATRPPVTLACVGCFHLQSHDEEEPAPVVYGHMIPAYCGYCGLVSPTCPGLVY
jgi:hypothetical protein